MATTPLPATTQMLLELATMLSIGSDASTGWPWAIDAFVADEHFGKVAIGELAGRLQKGPLQSARQAKRVEVIRNAARPIPDTLP